jgi:hypothetical protein
METPGQLGERGNDLNVEWQDRHDWRRGRTLQLSNGLTATPTFRVAKMTVAGGA